MGTADRQSPWRADAEEEEGGPDVGNTDVGSAAVYRTGCAGRIVAFSETDGGRYLVTLAGLLRFDVATEVAAEGISFSAER